MKVKNTTARGLVVSDVLIDRVSQYQSGIKNLSFAPLGSSGDTQVVPSGIAGLSAALLSLLKDGSLQIVGGDESLDGQAVTGILGGAGGGPAFEGVVKTARIEAGPLDIFRIMFGTPGVGDEVVDLSIYGYDVAITADVIVSADAAANLSGTVTNAKSLSAGTGKVIVTFTGSAATAQAGYTIFAKQAV